MITCKELGYKEGDKFRVIESKKHALINDGDILTLVEDDGSDKPFFSGSSVDGWKDMVSCKLDRLEKIGTSKTLDEAFGEWGGTGVDFNPSPTPNKYIRIIHGVEVDVYDVLKAWDVTCPATQHAIKKLLMPGQRGSKNKFQDLKEAEQSIKRAIELNRQTL